VVFFDVGTAGLAGVDDAVSAGDLAEAEFATGVFPFEGLVGGAVGAWDVVAALVALEVVAFDAA